MMDTPPFVKRLRKIADLAKEAADVQRQLHERKLETLKKMLEVRNGGMGTN